jgi:hypothetical protein
MDGITKKFGISSEATKKEEEQEVTLSRTSLSRFDIITGSRTEKRIKIRDNATFPPREEQLLQSHVNHLICATEEISPMISEGKKFFICHGKEFYSRPIISKTPGRGIYHTDHGVHIYAHPIEQHFDHNCEAVAARFNRTVKDAASLDESGNAFIDNVGAKSVAETFKTNPAMLVDPPYITVQRSYLDSFWPKKNNTSQKQDHK